MPKSGYHYPDSSALGTAMGDFSIQAFEDSGRENGFRYWLAHEFMRTLGYETWASFQSVITKAMGSCAKLGMDPTEAFFPDSFVGEDGREQKTYKLTRFACLLITVHGDSKKDEVAQAKAALAAIAEQLISQKIKDHDLGRIETREDLKFAEKQLAGAAQEAGLQDGDFGLFKDAGFRGMYNMSLKQLVVRKGADASKTLYDFMGLEELAGNLFRVTQTAARIKSTGTRGRDPLMRTAKEVGSEVRQMMKRNSGIAPEELPVSEVTVADVQKQFGDRGQVMDTKTGKVMSAKEYAQATGNVLKAVVSGEISLSAPTGQPARAWLESEKEQLRQAVVAIAAIEAEAAQK